MRPVGPNVPPSLAPLLTEIREAVLALQTPGKPQRMAHVALKDDLPPAADWPGCGIVCDEINSLVVSTLVTGSYAWLRADGSAL